MEGAFQPREQIDRIQCCKCFISNVLVKLPVRRAG